MTRSNRVRPVAVLAAGALLAVPLLAGCGAGQIANTANMVAAVPGANATATIRSTDPLYDNTTIAVRNVTVVYNSVNGYPAGGHAPLAAYFVNDTPAPMTLTGVVATYSVPGNDAGAGTATVVLTGGAAPATPSPVPPSTAPGSASPAVSPSGSGSASATHSTSGSAAPSPVATTPPPVGRSTFTVTIPQAPAELVALAPANGEYLQLTELSVPLLPGAVVHLVFTFRLGNGAIQTIGEDPAQPVDAPFGPPTSPAPRVPLPLSPTEG